MIIQNHNECTGCGACLQKCPQNAIYWKTAELGFSYPVIDSKKCIDCGLCDKACPIELKIPHFTEQKAFAAVHNSDIVLKNSTSGGAFTAMAEWVFARSGVVYGCAYGNDISPLQLRIDKSEQLYLFRGSKYVQSDTKNTFKEVENDLKAEKYVLYSGTPCQIEGLKAYLGKEYDKLICVDLVCHGVPSANYFIDYIRDLEKCKGIKISNFCFRDKKINGWSLSGTYSGTYSGTGKSFKKKLNYFDSYYYSYFLAGETYRKSCYTCKYAQLSRVGDFTLGDLWGAEGLKLPFVVSDGCSLMLINSNKAAAILKDLQISYKEISLTDAVKYNAQLKAPSSCNEKRNVRTKEYEDGNFSYIRKNFKKQNTIRNLKGKLKYAAPKPVKALLLK